MSWILSVMIALPTETLRQLRERTVVWCATVRPDGSPHLTPVWFVFVDEIWWIGTSSSSVKAHNLRLDDRVTLALGDGVDPVVAEGRANIVESSFPEQVVASFAEKYPGWDIRSTEPDGPRVLVAVVVERWLFPGTGTPLPRSSKSD